MRLRYDLNGGGACFKTVRWGLLALLYLGLAGVGPQGDEGPPGAGTAKAADKRALRVGTFESRAIAVAFAHSKYNTEVKDLMAEYTPSFQKNAPRWAKRGPDRASRADLRAPWA